MSSAQSNEINKVIFDNEYEYMKNKKIRHCLRNIIFRYKYVWVKLNYKQEKMKELKHTPNVITKIFIWYIT